MEIRENAKISLNTIGLQGMSAHMRTYPCFVWCSGIGVPPVYTIRGTSFFVHFEVKGIIIKYFMKKFELNITFVR